MIAKKATKKRAGPQTIVGLSGRAAAAEPALDTGFSTFPITGIGASAGGLAAFEAFFSGMSADTDSAGLHEDAGDNHCFGLASISERAINFGGKLDIDSSPDNGTTVTLTVPCAIAAKENQP